MRISLLIAATTLALGAACGGSSNHPQDPTPLPTEPVATTPAPMPPLPARASLDDRRKQLADLITEQWDFQMRSNPEWASFIGDHRFDDRWSDLSPEGIAAEQAKTADYLARFKAIDTTGFPDQDALNQQLAVYDLQHDVDDVRFENWLMPVSQQRGIHLELAQAATVLRFATVADYDNYIARLTKVPQVFDQIIALMRAGLAKQLMPPREQLLLTIGQTENLAKGSAAASPFAHPIVKFPADISGADQARIRTALLAAIDKQVFPSYRKLAAFLKTEYVPHGRAEPGEWSLPDGDARYAAAIERQTTTELTADAIHQTGLAEVTRIEGLQEAIGKQLGFPTLAAFRTHIRGNKKLYAKSREDILARYRKHVDEMYEQLPKLFGRLPKQRMTVEAMEPFREKDASGAEYAPGTPDGSRAGKVEVNTYDPTKRLWIDMESTAYHEGVPGHHLQIAIQQELPDLPAFRKYGGFTAFMEGWALYSEQLGKDVGFYKDPYSDYGRLQDEMLRAIRLVVDTGLHSKHWTRAQVVQFFHDHSTIDEPSVQSETNRYIVNPGQALAYKIGELTIMRLREEARAKLGDRFDIRAFHDFVLGGGALPLGVLETRFHAWLAAQQ